MSNNIFHHEEIHRGKNFTKKLNKKIVICGCGALGSNMVDMLVRQGFSNITVIDFDRIEKHNLNTQTFETKEVGVFKVKSAQDKAFRSVGVEIDTINKKLEKGNIKKCLKGADIVVDAFDNSESRQLIQDYCRANNVAAMHCGLTASYGECVWDHEYKVPDDGGEDICDYPLTRNIAMFIVTIACEELVDYCLSDSPRQKSWGMTLNDLNISPYK